MNTEINTLTAAPSTLPPHLLAILAGKMRAAPAPLAPAAARPVPTLSPLKTRTLSAIIDEAGELDVHDTPFALTHDDEGSHMVGHAGVDDYL